MNNVGFLRNYINENPTITLEEVLDDEEFLEELKIKNDTFLNYLKKHFAKLIEYLTIEPSVDVDYKRCYKFPYLSCEVFSTICPLFQNLLFNEENNLLERFFIYFIEKGDLNPTLTGYIERLIIKYIKYYTNDMKSFMVKNYQMFKRLLNQYQNDSICDICFKILIMPSVPDNENFEILRKEGFMLIGNTFLNSVDQVLNHDFQSDVTCNVLINVISILIRVINHINIFADLCEYLFQEVFNEFFFSKVEAIYYNKSDNKMTDVKISYNMNYVRIIENLNYLLFVILEKGLTRETKIENDGYDYTELFDFEVNAKTEKKDDMNENINENNNYYISKEGNPPVSLFELLSTDIKHRLINIYITSFSLISEINLKIKKYISETQKIPQSNGFSIIPVSKCYIVYIDILLGLLMTEDKYIYDYLKTNYAIFSTLISDLMDYGHNSFLHNKILKLFEIVFMSIHLEELKMNLIKNKYFDVLLSIDFDLYVDKNKKSILNNTKSLPNQAHVMKILNFFYLYINENQEVKESYSKNQKFIDFELSLLAYFQISTKDLHSKEVQSINDLKNSGDEKITFEKNFYDSEAFLSTTKKTLENSKKMNIKLKQLDDMLANN